MVTVVQGFGPFGVFRVNPSELLVRSLDLDDVVTAVLPVSMSALPDRIAGLMREHRPDVWLGVGLADGRTALSVEAVAVNLMSWGPEHADEDGNVSAPQPIAAQGPDAFFSTLPVQEILRAWRDQGIPGYLSQTAGSYLCNMSFYLATKTASDLGLATMVGFVHVPLFPELVTKPDRQPSMAMTLQQEGLIRAIDVCRTASLGTGAFHRSTG